MTYEQVASISQVAALLFFIALFAAVLIYAFWPGNKKRFDEAAKLPLEGDPEPESKTKPKTTGTSNPKPGKDD